ncbi:deoxycytidylate deaminase [Nonomuraea sp. NPDC059007]|uniref:deoxycytidylate deaminase n=1 Tax=Nonomuraea sp. NPDC059007 TaxID=3346692 RepID=UPI00369D96A3
MACVSREQHDECQEDCPRCCAWADEVEVEVVTFEGNQYTINPRPKPGQVLSRPAWHEYFLGIAEAVAARGDCRRRQVGAVVVDQYRRIVSTGYNGTWIGGPSCLAGDCPRAMSSVEPGSSYDTGPGTCLSTHAEANALLYAGVALTRTHSLYVTATPCGGCARLIRGAGIALVVTPNGKYSPMDL